MQFEKKACCDLRIIKPIPNNEKRNHAQEQFFWTKDDAAKAQNLLADRWLTAG